MIPKFRLYDLESCEMWVADDYEDLSEMFMALDTDNSMFSNPMQSTGLFDKNGTEIFESDIVKSCVLVNGHLYEYVGQVKFVAFSWNVVDKKQTYDPFYNYIDGYPDEIWEIEVTGNIYQNSDLLESVEE